MAPTRICVILCALISLSSSAFANQPAGGCTFEHFSKNGAADEPPREIDWGQRFINNELFKGEALNGIKCSPVSVQELQVKVEDTVNDVSVNVERTLRCAIIAADGVVGLTMGGKFLSDLTVIGDHEISGLTLTSENVHGVYLYSQWNITSDSKIRRVFIDGRTVEGIKALGVNFLENRINAVYLTDLRVDADNIERNKISTTSGGAYKVEMYGRLTIDDTQVESLEVDGMRLKAREINNTRIVGTELSGIFLDGHLLENTHIEGESLKNSFVVGSGTVDNVNIKASTLQNVRVVGGSAMHDVDIAVSGTIEDLFIQSSGSALHNVQINGFSVQPQEDFLQLQCSDKMGYPVDDEELGVLKRCFNKYCETMCGATKHATGKCFGRTCCCMQ